MPRGKNYVNNDKGVTLKSHKKSSSIETCYYGAGCNRKGCIYRHDTEAPDTKKTNDLCMAFLAGTCNHTENGCKKRHPNKQECERLRARYSKVKCRFGDECKTSNCLFTHPRDNKDEEPVAFEKNAFPSLNGDTTAQQKPAVLPGSAWRAAPPKMTSPSATPGGVNNKDFPPQEAPQQPQRQRQPPQQQQQASKQQPQSQLQQQQPTTPISAAAPAWFPGNPQEESHGLSPPLSSGGQAEHHENGDHKNSMKNLNINAKTWVPGAGFQ